MNTQVYTIATESTYLLFFGVPSIDLEQALKDRCKRFGTVERITKLSEYPNKEEFTDVFLVKFPSVQIARRAKRSLDNSNFYGGQLHVCYAPEYETVAECRVKLYLCRRDNSRVARKADHEYSQRFLKPPEFADVDSSKSSDPVVESTAFTPEPMPPLMDSVILSEGSSLNLAVLKPTGDALDDARRHWFRLGATFITSSTFTTEVDKPAASSPVTTTSSSSEEPHHSHYPRRPVPEAVMQALSWKPYQGSSNSGQRDPILDSKPSPSTQNHQPLTVGSFVPRCLRTKVLTGSRRETGRTKTNTSVSSHAITTEEVKRLALTLGPEQGPAAFPSPQTTAKRAARHERMLQLNDLHAIRIVDIHMVTMNMGYLHTMADHPPFFSS
ncbi:UPF0712 protein C7orf64 homolog [Clonorchis sinensis]|uniref:RNA-binding protein 48 n=1 Tax=Clonorchis sinensis TaxID=79923 RepID=G7YQP8_CLOSI|nr:UPF0712 protein C7orf64 homolog [Clonorchis sinensis]